MNAIETRGLGKRYRRTWAVRDCDLRVPAGQVTALVAAAWALNEQRDADLAAQRLSALGVATSARVGKLSGGQQTQLALTMALARRPRLLLLDEPLASLDPLARQDVLGWLMTCVAEDGLSVVFSSHVIPELERIASYLVVLSAGRLQVAATVDSLLGTHLALTGPADGVDDLYDQVEIVTAQRAGRQAVVLLSAVSAAICGAAAYWWYQIAQWQDGTSIWSWRWSSFELTPLSVAGWTVLAMALALLCGVLIRRVLPAMIAFAVAVGGCAYLAQSWLRPWLFGLGPAVKQVSFGTSAGWPPSTTTYLVRTWQYHDTGWVAYQPHSHLIGLEPARCGILVAAAALAVLASVWWLRIRPAD